MGLNRNKTAELDAEITRLAEICKLDRWTSFIDVMRVPGDMYPALATGRPELIKLMQPRDLKAEEVKVLFDVIAGLIETNFALREHAEQVAKMVENWTDAFSQLRSVGDKIEHFANFKTYKEQD